MSAYPVQPASLLKFGQYLEQMEYKEKYTLVSWDGEIWGRHWSSQYKPGSQRGWVGGGEQPPEAPHGIVSQVVGSVGEGIKKLLRNDVRDIHFMCKTWIGNYKIWQNKYFMLTLTVNTL